LVAVEDIPRHLADFHRHPGRLGLLGEDLGRLDDPGSEVGGNELDGEILLPRLLQQELGLIDDERAGE